LVPTSRRVGTNDHNVVFWEAEEPGSVYSCCTDRSVSCARPVFGDRTTDRTSIFVLLCASVVVRTCFFFATLRLYLPAVLRTALQAGVRSLVLLRNRRTGLLRPERGAARDFAGQVLRLLQAGKDYRPAMAALLISISLPPHRASSIKYRVSHALTPEHSPWP